MTIGKTTEYTTIEEYAKSVGKSVVTVRQKCERGTLPGAQKIGHTWLIPVGAVYVDARMKEGLLVLSQENDPEERKEEPAQQEMTPYQILDVFSKYSKYDPNQKSFNMMSSEYAFHKALDNIREVCEKYDPSGTMTVLYAKHIYTKVIKEYSIKMFEALEHPEEMVEEMKMYRIFTGESVKKIESMYIEALNQTIHRITGRAGIGERDLEAEKEAMYSSIEGVVEQLKKCNEEVYIDSGKPVLPVTNISTKIHLFNYMAECVLVLQNNASDGVYFCYINNNGTSDGYFAIMVKSNGNLFSVNDRVNESYIGQHTRSRNGRWTEGHKDIFPYEYVLTFSDHDYKGYATKYNVDESKLNISDLEAKAYIPIILAILCVMNGAKDKLLDSSKQVYLNTLIRSNLDQASETTALIPLDKTGLIDTTTKVLDIHFDREQFLGGKLDKKYTGNRETGKNQKFVDLYGQDFTPQSKPLSVLAPNFLAQERERAILQAKNRNNHALIFAHREEEKAEPQTVEFVGNLHRMERQAYYEARMELADHIRKKLDTELEKLGGMEGLCKWFGDGVRGNMERLYPVLAHVYDVTINNTNPYAYYPICKTDPLWIQHINMVKSDEYWNLQSRHFVYNVWDGENRGAYICPITGTKAADNLFFRMRAYSWKDIEAFTGQKVPGLLEGWYSDYYSDKTDEEAPDSFYGGNPILDVVDAVDFIDPFETFGERGARFEYFVGFSKRGINKLMTEFKKNGGKYLPDDITQT